MKFYKLAAAVLALSLLCPTAAVFAEDDTLGIPDEELFCDYDTNCTVKEDHTHARFQVNAADEIKHRIILANGEMAYCYDANAKFPSYDDGTTYYPYTLYNPEDPSFDQAFAEIADMIRMVIYVGYPFDAFGLKEKYGYTETFAYQDTQLAIWMLQSFATEQNLEHILESVPCEQSPYLFDLLTYALNFDEYKPEQGTLTFDETVFYPVDEEAAYDQTSYQTKWIHSQGYTGTFSLTLPEGVKAYVKNADNTEKEVSAEDKIPTGAAFRLVAEKFLKDTEITASYDYDYPSELYYYQPYSEANKEDLQPLLSFDKGTDTSICKFTFQYDENVDVPTPGPDPTPDEEIPPYVPPRAQPPVADETIDEVIEEEDVPLAEPVVETPAQEPQVPAEEEITDEAVPLASVPQTGSFGALFAVLIPLSAGFMILGVVMAHRRKKQ